MLQWEPLFTCSSFTGRGHVHVRPGGCPPFIVQAFFPQEISYISNPIFVSASQRTQTHYYLTTENATTCVCITSREHSHCVSVLQLPGMLVPCDGFWVVEMHKWTFPLSLISGDLWSTVALTDPSLLGVMLLWTPLPLSMGYA